MTHDPAKPLPGIDPLHPGSGPMFVKRSPVAPGAERPDDDVPRQPHERDQSIDATADTPDPRMVQAEKDLEAGQMDTDMRAQPGLDAERRREAVGGPAGQENPPRDLWVDPAPNPASATSQADRSPPDRSPSASHAAPQRQDAPPDYPERRGQERQPDTAAVQPPRAPAPAPLDSHPPAGEGGTRTPAGSNYGDWVPDRTGRLHPDIEHPQDQPLPPPAGTGGPHVR